MKNGLWIRLRGYSPAIWLLALLPLAAQATPMSYEIGGYGYGGYSASWIHSAEYCTAGASDLDWNADNVNDQLCMGGTFKLPISGEIVGTWTNGSFDVTGGNIGWLPIIDGSLGGNYYDALGDPRWFLEIGLSALSSMTFYFEDLSEFFGADNRYPNYIGEWDMVLWGQNLEAYTGCANVAKSSNCSPWGIDIYATRVPEPGTLALLSLGLLILGFSGRRLAPSA